MSIREKIFNYIQTEHKNKLPLEEKIEYLYELKKEEDIDYSADNSKFVSKDGVIVQNVINNIKKYYYKDKLSIKQLMDCENLGILDNDKILNVEEEIQFLKRAQREGISLFEITKNPNNYCNNSIYKYIFDLREKYDIKALNKNQEDICENDLKIVINDENKKNILIEKIRSSAYKNITDLNDINKKFS